MQRTFVQTSIFSRKLDLKGNKYLLELVEDEILNNVEVGDLIRGTGGVRKLRIHDQARSKGKRGGLRIIYLDLPHRQLTYLIYLYGKDEAEDISSTERKRIFAIVSGIKGN